MQYEKFVSKSDLKKKTDVSKSDKSKLWFIKFK
jgi:hypothetical protein